MGDEKCPLSDSAGKFIEGFVTKEQCSEKHQTTKYVFGVLIALTAVFLGLVVLAASISYQASTTASEAVKAVQEAYNNAENVRKELHVHQAAQTERDRVVVSKLQEIRDEISQLRSEQTALMRAVIEKNDHEVVE